MSVQLESCRESQTDTYTRVNMISICKIIAVTFVSATSDPVNINCTENTVKPKRSNTRVYICTTFTD